MLPRKHRRPDDTHGSVVVVGRDVLVVLVVGAFVLEVVGLSVLVVVVVGTSVVVGFTVVVVLDVLEVVVLGGVSVEVVGVGGRTTLCATSHARDHVPVASCTHTEDRHGRHGLMYAPLQVATMPVASTACAHESCPFMDT